MAVALTRGSAPRRSWNLEDRSRAAKARQQLEQLALERRDVVGRQAGGGAGRQSGVQRRIARDEQVDQVAVDRAPLVLSGQRVTLSAAVSA